MSQQLNTVFLGVIAAVLLGAAGVWWSQQPSASERRAAEAQERTERTEAAVDRYVCAERRARGQSLAGYDCD